MSLLGEKTLSERKPSDDYEGTRNEHVRTAMIASKMASTLNGEEDYIRAVEFLQDVKTMRQKWQRIIRPAIQAAHEAHKRIIAVEREIDQPLSRAENEFLKPAIAKYKERLEERRKLEEKRLNRMIQDETGGEQSPVAKVIVPKKEDPKGISYVDLWSAEVIDLMELVKAVANGDVPMDVLQPNMARINQTAKALKDHLKWPGVKVNRTTSVRATGKKEA